MKRLLIFLVIVSYGNIALIAQDLCGTPSPTPPAWIFQNTSNRSNIIQQNSASNNTILNVFVHIVRSSNGQGLSSSIISGIISSLNTSYLNSKIQFNLIGSDYIDNDYYYNDLNNKENQLFTVNSKSNAINIYVLGEATIWSWAGQAQNIPSIAYIIHGSYYNTSSLPHEMGHCLGLYHTHHGTVHEGGDVNECAEWVNGNNSTTCGDYISDTAADPNLWANTSCNYTGTATDANGQVYTPNPSNLMSYSYKPCRNMFTTLQSERMQNFIANTQALQNVIHHEISGPSQICDQATYTINLPAGATVVWSSSDNLNIISGQGTSAATFSSAGKSGIVTDIKAVITLNGVSYSTTKYSIQVGNESAMIGVFDSDTGNMLGAPYALSTRYNIRALLNDAPTSSTSYRWAVTSPNEDDNIMIYQGQSFQFGAATAGSYHFVLRYLSECGWSTVSKDISFGNKVTSFSLSPNPAADQTEVSIAENTTNNLLSSTSENTNSISYQVKVVDSYGLTVYSATKKEKKFNLQTSSFRNGVYAVIVSDGTNTYQNKLIVKH